jgi:hypothetical protein
MRSHLSQTHPQADLRELMSNLFVSKGMTLITGEKQRRVTLISDQWAAQLQNNYSPAETNEASHNLDVYIERI